MTNEAVVLIVDDDDDIRDTLRELVEQDGYRVATAAHGLEALEKLRAEAGVGLILLDLMMPVMDGYQFMTEMKKDPALADIPVLVITADGNALQKARAIGARGQLRKPFTPEALLVSIAAMIGPPPAA